MKTHPLTWSHVTYKILSLLFVLPSSINFYEQFLVRQPISIEVPYKFFNGYKFLMKSVKATDTISLMGTHGSE